MSLLNVDEYYEFYLRGKSEEQILGEVERLRQKVLYWKNKWLAAAEDEYNASQAKSRYNPIKKGVNWYRYKVKNLAPETDEIFEARTEWAFAGTYLKRAEQALAEVRAKKASVPTHQIVIIKVTD